MDKRERVFVAPEELEKQKHFMALVRRSNQGSRREYTIITIGCQMNENDSEKLAGMLMEMGYEKSDDTDKSDLIIYNTCCVRKNAELKVYGHLGAMKKLKKKNPGLIIAVCGCMMQQKEAVEHIRSKYSHVNIVFGTHNLYRFPEMLYNAIESDAMFLEVMEADGSIAEGLPIARADGIKAWVSIMYGCNNFCSYCVVPYVRGRERSRKPEDIIEEVKSLGREGYKEITLLGQNVNSYGKDLDEKTDFPSLLYSLNNQADGIERVRFVTSHPKDLSDDLINVMKGGGKICESMHLPVQSGSTRVLSAMNRKYSREHYLERVEKLRESVPGISLTTDIIVGFPGETEEDFEETLSLVEKVKFDMAYTFIYSPRAGTPASTMENQLDEKTKKRRFNRLVELQNRISKELNMKLKGSDVVVLVEGTSKTNRDFYTGRTRTNKIVNFKGNEQMVGKLVMVNIEKVMTWYLSGTVVS